MSYAEKMQESTNTWAAAYLQFKSGVNREDYLTYAFVEDHPDKPFYQSVLSEYAFINYLPCGGKSGVISVFNQLTSEGYADRKLFFVDRDTEREPFQNPEDICRTRYYSWESHFCQPDFVKRFMQARLDKNLTIEETKEIGVHWVTTVDAFRDSLVKHIALCRTADRLDVSLGLGDINLAIGATMSSEHLEPGRAASDWFDESVRKATALGALDADIEKRQAFYEKTELLHTARGKTLFNVLRAFIDKSLNRLGRKCAQQYNSPRHMIEMLPWLYAELAYIRDYAARRLA